MNRRQERAVWISLVSVLGLALALVLFTPSALARTREPGSMQTYMRKLEAAFHIISENYVDEVDQKDLFKGAMKGLFDSLDDPYSLYLDDEILQQMRDTTEGKYGGVGLYIGRDHFDEENPRGRLPYVKVVAPIENTPGWRAGINAGDYIYAIEGESAEGFSTQDVSDRLRGRPGSDVKVTILRGKITFDLVLTRQEIEIPTVKSAVINNSIGYVRIIEFTPYTEVRVRESLKDFASRGLDKLIVDVRSNPGGRLDSVVDVADLFFSGGTIVSTKYRQARHNRVHRAAPGKVVPSSTGIVVLIDRGSASAAEILTGALKDRERATIIGEKSFGKGSIQQVVPLSDAEIKLTTGRYYTPSGVSIDKVGIEPDIVVEEPELGEEEAGAYATLLQENRIALFVNEHQNPSKSDVDSLIGVLNSENLNPGDRVVRMMVKRESERRMNTPPVVDTEYDTVLIRAIDFLENQ